MPVHASMRDSSIGDSLPLGRGRTISDASLFKPSIAKKSSHTRCCAHTLHCFFFLRSSMLSLNGGGTNEANRHGTSLARFGGFLTAQSVFSMDILRPCPSLSRLRCSRPPAPLPSLPPFRRRCGDTRRQTIRTTYSVSCASCSLREGAKRARIRSSSCALLRESCHAAWPMTCRVCAAPLSELHLPLASRALLDTFPSVPAKEGRRFRGRSIVGQVGKASGKTDRSM